MIGVLPPLCPTHPFVGSPELVFLQSPKPLLSSRCADLLPLFSYLPLPVPPLPA